jgi:hypothetical protein
MSLRRKRLAQRMRWRYGILQPGGSAICADGKRTTRPDRLDIQLNDQHVDDKPF